MASNVKIRQLIVEKYRPTSMDTYVFQNKETEALVRKWMDEGEFPNVMLSGSAGTGKSTLARILSNMDGINQADVKRINASSTNGIGFIRDELEPWLKRSSYGKFKVVVLEEFDRFTPQAQDALRDISEVFSDDARFIGTCNHPRRISEALQSRFEAGRIHIEEINRDGIIDLCLDILEAEDVIVNTEEDILSHIDAYAPDMRKILNSFDKHIVDKQLHRLKEAETSGDFGMWVSVWDAEELDWESLLELTEGIDATNYDDYFSVMYNNHRHFPSVSSGLIHLADYLYKCSFVANHRLLLDACLYHIFEVNDD